MLDLHIVDETSQLKSVVLGTAESLGGTPRVEDAYDPKSIKHIMEGTFPTEEDLVHEMSGFEEVLVKHGVRVYRPELIADLHQVYARDIGFVVGDRFVVSMILKNRRREKEGIEYLVEQMDPTKVIRPEKGIRIEGGDVMPWKGKLFVGYSKKEDFDTYTVSRTNEEGVDFLKSTFGDWEVIPMELVKSDTDPMYNSLHLDCCFQPVGHNQAIIFDEGFKNPEDPAFLRSFFGDENMITIDRTQMYNMHSNVFSISPKVIVSDESFVDMNNELRERGFTVEEIPYSEVSKMEGLMRCSTLPLYRSPEQI